MTQSNYNIPNDSAPAVRSQLNSVFQSIATNNSGTSAPSTTFAHQWWYDSTTNILKQRNAADSAFINIGTFDQTNGTFTPAGQAAGLTQTQAEDPASTVFGTVSGQRLAQAVVAFEALKSYESAQQTITTAGLLTLSHGLGGIPRFVAFTLVCITSEFGFSAGQHVDVANIDSTSSTATVFSIGWVAARTSSEILVRFGSSAALLLINLSNGGIAFGTPANWRLIVRATL